MNRQKKSSHAPTRAATRSTSGPTRRYTLLLRIVSDFDFPKEYHIKS